MSGPIGSEYPENLANMCACPLLLRVRFDKELPGLLLDDAGKARKQNMGARPNSLARYWPDCHCSSSRFLRLHAIRRLPSIGSCYDYGFDAE